MGVWDDLGLGPKSDADEKACRFEPIEANQALANYMTSEVYRIGADTFVPELTVPFPDSAEHK